METSISHPPGRRKLNHHRLAEIEKENLRIEEYRKVVHMIDEQFKFYEKDDKIHFFDSSDSQLVTIKKGGFFNGIKSATLLDADKARDLEITKKSSETGKTSVLRIAYNLRFVSISGKVSNEGGTKFLYDVTNDGDLNTVLSILLGITGRLNNYQYTNEYKTKLKEHEMELKKIQKEKLQKQQLDKKLKSLTSNQDEVEKLYDQIT